jgi:diketogulonate reductase-like aldo/keto reductase
MKTTTLSNGIKMPILGIGTFLVNEQDGYETVKEALKVGYRHIDTAQAYRNETEIGRAIKDSGIPREEIFVTTKLSARKLGYKEASEALDESLSKLGLEYVDLYLIHWPSSNSALNQETWKGMEVCYNTRRAHAIGVSNFQIHHLLDLFKVASVMPAVNQVEMHPGLQQEALKVFLDKNNIKMISYGPFMKGEVFNRTGKFYETLDKIGDNHKASVAQVIIAWGLQRGIMMIPKSVTPSRILENFKALDLVLTNEEMEMISLLNQGIRVYTDPDNVPYVKK